MRASQPAFVFSAGRPPCRDLLRVAADRAFPGDASVRLRGGPARTPDTRIMIPLRFGSTVPFEGAGGPERGHVCSSSPRRLSLSREAQARLVLAGADVTVSVASERSTGRLAFASARFDAYVQTLDIARWQSAITTVYHFLLVPIFALGGLEKSPNKLRAVDARGAGGQRCVRASRMAHLHLGTGFGRGSRVLRGRGAPARSAAFTRKGTPGGVLLVRESDSRVFGSSLPPRCHARAWGAA